MKNIILILIVISSILITSCADSKQIDGKVYRPYGLLNEKECKNDSIHYEVSPFAAISGIVFIETIICPIYIYGFNLYEPICKEKDFINNSNNKGVIN